MQFFFFFRRMNNVFTDKGGADTSNFYLSDVWIFSTMIFPSDATLIPTNSFVIAWKRCPTHTRSVRLSFSFSFSDFSLEKKKKKQKKNKKDIALIAFAISCAIDRNVGLRVKGAWKASPESSQRSLRTRRSSSTRSTRFDVQLCASPLFRN